MNYTWPGRFHLMWRDEYRWVTLWLWGRRFHHFSTRSLGESPPRLRGDRLTG